MEGEPRTAAGRALVRVHDWTLADVLRIEAEASAEPGALDEWPKVDCRASFLHDHRVEGGFVGPFDGPHSAEGTASRAEPGALREALAWIAEKADSFCPDCDDAVPPMPECMNSVHVISVKARAALSREEATSGR